MILLSQSFLLWLYALVGAQSQQPVAVSRLVVRDEIIIRVPVVRPRQRLPIRWIEKKGPKCIGAGQLAAAALAEDNSIDFLLRDRRRIRAKIDRDCPTLDFYGGFYLQPEDERVCARRDEIRNRMGQSCRIERFRLMVPQIVR